MPGAGSSNRAGAARRISATTGTGGDARRSGKAGRVLPERLACIRICCGIHRRASRLQSQNRRLKILSDQWPASGNSCPRCGVDAALHCKPPMPRGKPPHAVIADRAIVHRHRICSFGLLHQLLVEKAQIPALVASAGCRHRWPRRRRRNRTTLLTPEPGTPKIETPVTTRPKNPGTQLTYINERAQRHGHSR